MKRLLEIYWISIVILTLSFLIIHTFPIIQIDIIVDNTTIYLILILIILPLIPRLKKIKWKDIEAEISSEEIKKVKNAVDKVKSKYPLPFDERVVKGYDMNEASNLSIYLLELVETDNILAIATLRTELERVIRCMFNEINEIMKVDFATIGVFGMISFLRDNTNIDEDIFENSYNIISTCNKVLHGGKIKNKDAHSLVDSGHKVLNHLHGFLFAISSKSFLDEMMKKNKKIG